MGTSFKIVVIEGPSGVGKDTLINGLINSAPNKYKKITSYTTREKRPHEREGELYHYIDQETFLKKYENGDIFERTTRHGTYRGMSKSIINDIIDNGLIAIKDVDIVGMHAIKAAYPNAVKTIFLTADKEIVKKRLEKRGDSVEDLAVRLQDYDNIHKNINQYDHIITNNHDPSEAITKAIEILKENKK